MGGKRFTDEQIANFLAQSKNGVPNKILCEKYNFSASTLRRWKELHDESIRNELKKMESTSLKIFLCLTVVSVILSSVFSKAAGVLYIPLLTGHCVFYIVRFRKKSSEFMISENKFSSRTGLGARNSFYRFSWLFVGLLVLIFTYAVIK